MRRSSFILAAGCSLAFSAAGSWAWGFATQGYRWPNQANQPVLYQLHPVGSDDVPNDDSELEALRRAFATWDNVACSYLQFRETAWTEPRRVAPDNGNRVGWVEDAAEWPGDRQTLALTYTFFTQDGTNQIIDADMIFNGVNWVWTTTDSEVGQGTPAKVDIETVAFHEAGHFLGLDHSNDTQAAMYPSNNKLMQRGPANDDIQGVCTLYGNGQSLPGTSAGQGQVGAPCTSDQDCASSLCAQDDLIQRTYCTARCTPGQAGACPGGYVCENTPQGGFCLVPPPVDELCDECSSGNQCNSGLCIQVPNINDYRTFCSQACDPTPGQPQQCPSGFECRGTQHGNSFIGACVPSSGICNPLGKGGQNEVCYASGGCKAGLACVEYYQGSGLNYCYAQCPIEFTGQACNIPRTACLPVQGVMNTNVCFSVASEAEPCIPEICSTGNFCAFDETSGIDSALCYRICGRQEDCRANHQCVAFEGLPALCVPNEGFKADGDACAGDAECDSKVCRTFGSVKLCTRVCATTSEPSDCSAGMLCRPDPGTEQGLCWPEYYTDPNAKDPTRPGPLPPTYCACDTTSKCDSDCECDAECGGSCSCASTETSGSAAWLLGLLLVMPLRKKKKLLLS